MKVVLDMCSLYIKGLGVCSSSEITKKTILFFPFHFDYAYSIFEPLMLYGETNQNRNLCMSKSRFRDGKRVVRISKVVLLCHCVSRSVVN